MDNLMFAKRLLDLAAFLDNVPEERFGYNSWVSGNWNGKPLEPSHTCLTTACALGWATAMPQFAALGMELRPMGDWNDNGYVCMKSDEHPNSTTSKKAGMEVFGLTDVEFEYLFLPETNYIDSFARYDEAYEPDDSEPIPDLNADGPGEEATAKEVAAHIRQFVRAKYRNVL